MREILFRGKRLDNGEWIMSGNIIHFNEDNLFYIAKQNGKCIHLDDLNDNILQIEEGTFYKVDPATVGQFTGLTDKNGTKIFEGDILQTEDRIVVVEWHRPSASWDSKFVKYLEPRESWWTGILCSQWGEYAAVIGNIHDNPELIGGAGNGL